ncbi:MAG: GatB/YqeY domain-containing protein [Bacteroidota bacterium]
MSLKETIDADIKKAMLAKEKDALRALRAIKSLILLEETKEGAGGSLSPDAEMKLLTRAAKQRRESSEIFKTQGREDLAETEQAELSIIENYLPKQLTDAELTDKVKAIAERVGAKSPADMGKVMGVASKELAGLADGKAVSETVKRILAGG